MHVFDDLSRLPAKEREDAVYLLFTRLSRSDSRSDDEVVGCSMRRFLALYNATKDESLLRGLDRVRLDAGFWDSMCSFYKDICESEAAVVYYRRPENAGRIRECKGEWSSAEISQVLGGGTLSGSGGGR